MPISDYGSMLDGAAAVAVIGFRARIRAYVSRLTKRGKDTVDGHRIGW